MKIIKVKIISVILIFMLASVWHFMYEWFSNFITSLLFPVNESPWEHVKLLFLPAVIFYYIEYRIYGKKYKNFIPSHTISILLMPIMMFTLFYGYQMIGIEENLIIDILITFIVISLGSFIAYKIMLSKYDLSKYINLSYLVLIGMFILYSIFTYYPPKAKPFLDSNSNSYGIVEDHNH